MGRCYYVASCLFTARFPEVSMRIQAYIRAKGGIETVRCCIPKYRVRKYEERLPEGGVRDAWKALPQSADFQPGDTVFSICPNCINILAEWKKVENIRSLWELIDADPDFAYPDYAGMRATLQDCWRTRDRKEEQDAVRSLLRKMHIDFAETEKNREHADFCGSTLFREQPSKNSKLAPRHYVEQAEGKFYPHAEEEQLTLMREHCRQYGTETVVCYCHYCLEGLLQGGAGGVHLASLLFPGSGENGVRF